MNSPGTDRKTRQEITMGKLIVTEFISLDGVIEDPGGAEGSSTGGVVLPLPRP
jgi:hypothetical protein